jgi:5-methyltetrahydrofolate--homocysteine methyltransferase
MMLKGACFAIEDYGIDVPPEKFVEAVKKENADIIAMSSLLTTSMGAMRETINSLIECGVRDKVKIIVGGAPITQDYADSIGADAYAKDAATAVDKVKELIRKKD